MGIFGYYKDDKDLGVNVWIRMRSSEVEGDLADENTPLSVPVLILNTSKTNKIKITASGTAQPHLTLLGLSVF